MLLADEDIGDGGLICDLGEGRLDGGAIIWGDMKRSAVLLSLIYHVAHYIDVPT